MSTQISKSKYKFKKYQTKYLSLENKEQIGGKASLNTPINEISLETAVDPTIAQNESQLFGLFESFNNLFKLKEKKIQRERQDDDDFAVVDKIEKNEIDFDFINKFGNSYIKRHDCEFEEDGDKIIVTLGNKKLSNKIPQSSAVTSSSQKKYHRHIKNAPNNKMQSMIFFVDEPDYADNPRYVLKIFADEKFDDIKNYMSLNIITNLLKNGQKQNFDDIGNTRMFHIGDNFEKMSLNNMDNCTFKTKSFELGTSEQQTNNPGKAMLQIINKNFYNESLVYSAIQNIMIKTKYKNFANLIPIVEYYNMFYGKIDNKKNENKLPLTSRYTMEGLDGHYGMILMKKYNTLNNRLEKLFITKIIRNEDFEREVSSSGTSMNTVSTDSDYVPPGYAQSDAAPPNIAPPNAAPDTVDTSAMNGTTSSSAAAAFSAQPSSSTTSTTSFASKGIPHTSPKQFNIFEYLLDEDFDNKSNISHFEYTCLVLINIIYQVFDALLLLKQDSYLFFHSDLKIENVFCNTEIIKISEESPIRIIREYTYNEEKYILFKMNNIPTYLDGGDIVRFGKLSPDGKQITHEVMRLADFDKSSITYRNIRFRNDYANFEKYELATKLLGKTIPVTARQVDPNKYDENRGNNFYNIPKITNINVAEFYQFYLRYAYFPYYMEFDFQSFLVSLLRSIFGGTTIAFDFFNILLNNQEKTKIEEKLRGVISNVLFSYENPISNLELLNNNEKINPYKGNFGDMIEILVFHNQFKFPKFNCIIGNNKHQNSIAPKILLSPGGRSYESKIILSNVLNNGEKKTEDITLMGLWESSYFLEFDNIIINYTGNIAPLNNIVKTNRYGYGYLTGKILIEYDR
jgi:hypothetical protein